MDYLRDNKSRNSTSLGAILLQQDFFQLQLFYFRFVTESLFSFGDRPSIKNPCYKHEATLPSYYMPLDVHITTPLIWTCTGILAVLDVILILLVHRFVNRDSFRKMRGILPLVGGISF